MSAADVGAFYSDYPQHEVFRGKWKPSKHCERDGRLTWVSDPAAPGAGWIYLLASRPVQRTAQPTATPGALDAEGDSDDPIAMLSATKLSSDRFSAWLATQDRPHPAILEIVQSAGNSGIDIPTLRMQIPPRTFPQCCRAAGT